MRPSKRTSTCFTASRDSIPFEAFLSPDGLHMNDWSCRCFAKVLADAIADAATPDRESGTDAKAVEEEPR